jgi:sugar lactone lactonase YvrE
MDVFYSRNLYRCGSAKTNIQSLQCKPQIANSRQYFQNMKIRTGGAVVKASSIKPFPIAIAIIYFFCFGSVPRIAALYGSTTETCLNHTGNEGQCKDCCDCLEDAKARKTCRDSCIAKSTSSTGFGNNTDLITINAPSSRGPRGDYSAATAAGNERDCKTYCDESDLLACGDRRYCRDTCNATFSGGAANPPGRSQNDQNSGSNISIEQAISDEAQQNTISFDGLAFVTGNQCGDTFLPPGKVADFSGFQYLRDTDPTNLGHNTDFVTIIAFNMLNIMTTSQIEELVALAKTQISMINEYGYARFPLMKAFRRLIEGDVPKGSTGLSKAAVMAYSADLYRIDGEISYGRAKALGSILRNFTAQQKAKLDSLKALNGVGNWTWDSSQRNPLETYKLDKDMNVAVMTYASEMYSWYAGSVEADTYFCPERQGTYFGSFYMKDAPAMAAGPGFTIPSNLTADMGSNFLKELTSSQAALITNLVDFQRSDLLAIVDTRRAISTALRKFIETDSVSESSVLALAEKYGQLDGAIVYQYATNFARVSGSLSSEQRTKLKSLRETWNTISCSGAYLYSEKINMPEIMNTDFLFETSANKSVTAGTLQEVANGFTFAEGPAVDASGNIYFSDVSANRIYRWSPGSGISIFRENSGGSNGLFFDQQGKLIACEGTNGRLVSIDSAGKASTLADKYSNKAFNEPNDLWIDPKGGIYFSDPVYFKSSLTQDGEYVYYLNPERANVARVISDMVRPNGIIGTPDGKTLYVADHGAGKTYVYDINDDGTLSSKRLFVDLASDGMTIDAGGNIYLTNDNVLVYDHSGNLIETIEMPQEPTNLSFGGADNGTLFITTKAALYSIAMQVRGVSGPDSTWARIKVDVAKGGSAIASTASRESETQAGYATVKVQSGSTPYGTAVFSFKQNGVTISEAAVPATPPVSSARLFIDYRSGVPAVPGRNDSGTIDVNTGIAVINPGSATANVSYELKDSNGIILAVGHGTLAAGNHFAKFIGQLNEVAADFSLPTDFQSAVQFGSLDINSDQPVSVLALRGTLNQRDEFLISTTPVADLGESPYAGSLYFPQFVDGGGYNTSLLLLNSSAQTASGTIQIFNNDGSPLTIGRAGGRESSSFRYSIPSNGIYRFQSDGSPATTTGGWVRLTPDPSSPTPVGAGVFAYSRGNILVSESGVPSSVPTTHARVYVDLSGGHNTGIALADAGFAAPMITIKAYQADGVTNAGTGQGSLQLARGGHDAQFADQFIKGLPADFKGVLDISSPTSFAAVTLRSLSNERKDFLITTFPVADANQIAPSPITFPQIADGGGYTTQFIFIGAGAPSAMTLSFYDNEGKPLIVGK